MSPVLSHLLAALGDPKVVPETASLLHQIAHACGKVSGRSVSACSPVHMYMTTLSYVSVCVHDHLLLQSVCVHVVEAHCYAVD